MENSIFPEISVTVIFLAALLMTYFLVDSVLDHFGVNTLGFLNKKDSRKVRKEKSLVSGFLFILIIVVVLLCYISNFGWIHLIFSPLIFADIIVVGRLLSPNFAGANPSILKSFLTVTALILHPTMGDGGDTGGSYRIFGLINSQNTDSTLIEIFDSFFLLSLVIHIVTIVVSFVLIYARTRKRKSLKFNDQVQRLSR